MRLVGIFGENCEFQSWKNIFNLFLGEFLWPFFHQFQLSNSSNIHEEYFYVYQKSKVFGQSAFSGKTVARYPNQISAEKSLIHLFISTEWEGTSDSTPFPGMRDDESQ